MVNSCGSVCVLGLTFGAVYLCTKFYQWLWRSSVQNKVVLITGASSGLGEALAHVFYEAGSKVILAARRQDELQRVKQELLSMKVVGPTLQPECILLDLEKLADIPKVAADVVSRYGHVDVLINNGGISYRGDVIDTDINVNVKLMTVNHFGHIALTKGLLSDMRSYGGGHIVYVSSVQGKISIPQRSAYSAAKHASQAFFDALRAEEAHHNIKVSVVSPAYIRTNLSKNAVTSSGQLYGETDAATESGMDPGDVADSVIDAVRYGSSEVLLAPVLHHLSVYIRTLCPSLYFLIMKRRADKHRRQLSKLK